MTVFLVSRIAAPAGPLVLAALFAAGVAAPSTAGRRDAVERPIVPDRAAVSPPYEVDGLALGLTAKGVRIRVEPLDERRRETWFALRSRLPGDPLPKREAYPTGFAVFELSFLNNSSTTLHFAPNLTTCWHSRDHELRPLHLDQVIDLVRALYVGAGDATQEAVDGLRAFHVEPLALEPGRRVSRLLVFRGPPAQARDLTLDLGRLQIGSDTLTPRFPFLLVDERDLRPAGR